MGQIVSKIYQKACIYDFTVDGGTAAVKNLGMAIVGGESIISLFYTVLIPLATASVNITAGFNALGIMGFVTHTVAQLNAGVGGWLVPGAIAGFPFKQDLQANDCSWYFDPNANPLTAGKMLFSFTIMSHPL